MNDPNASLTSQSGWSLERWLDYMLAIHPADIDMGLARVKTVFERFNLQWSNSKVITVAGTNGKGSTCRFIEAVLLAKGHSVGVYSSPHLVDYRERVRINGVSPSEQSFCEAFLSVERARGDTSLTYFEFGTLAALAMLHKESPDFVILEVGLGGRLDATNIVNPDIAVITSIGIDHQEYLGDTRESVAQEKAGIFRRDIPIVVGESDPPENMLTIAADHSQQLLLKGRDFDIAKDSSLAAWNWQLNNGNSTFALVELPKPVLSTQNISTALAALHALEVLPNVNQQLIADVITKTSLPGRFQKIAESPNWYLDVAHNPQAAELLSKQIAAVCEGRLFIILGMMQDKAIAETLRHFANLSAYWFPVTLQTSRAAQASELGQVLSKQKVVAEFSTTAEAVNAVLHRVKENDTVLVFGSFVTVADVLTLQAQGLI